MTKLEELLRQVKELDEKATAGPWTDVDAEDFDGYRASITIGSESSRATLKDVELIAHYRTAAPKLAKVCAYMHEQLALMSEGEGPDPDVYVQMANGALAEVDSILSSEEKILENIKGSDE